MIQIILTNLNLNICFLSYYDKNSFQVLFTTAIERIYFCNLSLLIVKIKGIVLLHLKTFSVVTFYWVVATLLSFIKFIFKKYVVLMIVVQELNYYNKFVICLKRITWKNF